MTNIFSSIFSIHISQDFCVHRTKSNIKLSTYLCYAIVIMDILLLLNDYIRYSIGKWTEFPAMEYITYSHIGYLCSSVGFLLWKYYFFETASPKQRNLAVMGLINSMFFFCLTITVAAQHMHGQVTMYVLGISVVAFLMVLSPKEILASFVGIGLLTPIVLYIWGNPELFSATTINLSSCVIVVIIIAYYMFHLQRSSFNKSKLIKEQQAELILAKTNLEQKVVERTQALKKVNGELLDAKSEFNSLVYRSSHDLRGPIASVLGLVQVIKLGETTPTTKQYLGMIETSIQKMDRVMAEINEITTNSEETLSYQSIEMRSYFEQLFTQVFANEKITFTLNIPTNTHIISDKKRLDTIFYHILKNVLDYQDTRKAFQTCNIEFSFLPNAYQIEVTDNGIGIPAQFLPQIGQMFFKATNGKGSGLGLYIVKKALASLNGSLSVVSQEGEFTKMTISLPLQ